MSDPDELFRLVLRRAEAISGLPPDQRNAALAGLHGEHEAVGLKAGMTRQAALDMANRLDTWVREALRLRETSSHRPVTRH